MTTTALARPRVGATKLARTAASLGLSAALAAGLGLAGLAPAATSTTAADAGTTPAPAMAPVSYSQPTLRQGDRGGAVADLQRQLSISSDGVFGPQTRGAVVAFQGAHGLSTDGVVGPMTWGVLGGAPAAAPAPATSAARAVGTPTLRQGDSGPAVTDLQRRLGISADGAFGPQTRASVVGFQSSRGLGADGVVGPQTWAALTGGEAPRASRSETRQPVAASSRGGALIAEAQRHVGKPYVYGTAGPSSFDCSGFTRYVFGQLGVSLPHNTVAQYAAVQHVPVSDMQRGDLVFVRTGGSITHVGIYDSDGYWYVARHTGTTITRQKIYTSNIVVGRA